MWRRTRVKLVIAGFMMVFALASLAPVKASSANISRSFQSKAPISPGSMVSLDPVRSDYVEAANVSNSSRLTGVVVVKDDSLIAADGQPGATQVATTGNALTLVSDLNGSIKVGDQITASPLNGIGMKVTSGSRIIGLAQTDFDSHSEGVDREITDKHGQKTTVHVGYVRVGINITNSGGSSGAVVNDLQRAVQSVTGRVVPTYRIIISIGIIAVAILALITLTYASIYGSIISVGRNPLAKYAVFRTLAAVLGMALLTAVVAGISIFFLLK